MWLPLLAVNLSDLAAMGAEPCGSCCPHLPEVNEDWLAGFPGACSNSPMPALRWWGETLPAGRWPFRSRRRAVPAGLAMRRSGAKCGERICLGGVTGAGLHGMHLWQHGCRHGPAIDHFRRPQPQLSLGLSLRGLASACIDISDGVLADLNHVLEASGGLGATLDEAALPLDAAILCDCDHEEQRRLQLQGGDDYVLLFTLRDGAAVPAGCHVIGRVDAQPGVRLYSPAGECRPLSATGWRHFARAACTRHAAPNKRSNMQHASCYTPTPKI